MKKIVIIFCTLLFIFSCSKKEESSNKPENSIYNNKGLSFEMPQGWKVQQDITNKEGRFLELNKYENYQVQSAVAISIFSKDENLDSIMHDQIKQLQFFYQKVKFKLIKENVKDSLFKYSAILSTYEADDTRSKVYGKIYLIKEKEKPVVIQIVENTPKSYMDDYRIIFNKLIIP